MAWRYKTVNLPPQITWEEEEDVANRELVEEPFWVPQTAQQLPLPDEESTPSPPQIPYIYVPNKPDLDKNEE